MHWIVFALFLFAIEFYKNDATTSFRKIAKELLDTKVGAKTWKLALPNGGNVEETANVAERMQKILIRSHNLADTSGMDNATILMDFKKGMMAVLFMDVDMCFFIKDKSLFTESVEELKQRKNSETPIPQGNPITFYALNEQRIINSTSLWNKGGPAVFKLCRSFIENGNVFQVVKDSTENMQPDTLTASGYISATQPGKSVPVVVKLQDNTIGGLESSSSSYVTK